MIKRRTRKGSLFSEQSTIHKFLRARVMATYRNFNLMRMEDEESHNGWRQSHELRTSEQILACRLLSNSGAGISVWLFSWSKFRTTRHWERSALESSKNLYNSTYGPKFRFGLSRQMPDIHIIKFESFAFIKCPKRHELKKLQEITTTYSIRPISPTWDRSSSRDASLRTRTPVTKCQTYKRSRKTHLHCCAPNSTGLPLQRCQ